MRYLMHRLWKRFVGILPSLALLVIGAVALAGMAFIYTANQYYNQTQIGTGVEINISALPEELASAMGLIVTALMVSMFTLLFAARGDFVRGIAVLFGEGTLSLVLLYLAYVMPGLLGEVEYLPNYYVFVIKQVLVVAVIVFPFMLIGGVAGMFMYDRIGEDPTVSEEEKAAQ